MPLLAYIHINVDPIVVQSAGFAIHWYGLIMAVAAIAGTFVFAWQLEKRGIDRSHAWSMLLLAVPLAIIGARLFHILDDFSFYWHNPGDIVTKQLIGLAIYGVITGGVLAVIIYCRWRKLPTWRVLDGLALAIPVGQLIGRCANIINGDTWGSATGLPWGLVYTNPHALLPASLLGVPTQPTPIYEQLWLIVVIAVVWWAMPRLKTDGVAFLLYLGMYSFGRFFISFLRVNNELFLGMREAQLIALVVFIAVFPTAWWLRRRQAARIAAAIPPRP
jgi:phosphatidylglycerol---prolipoprotein diacylglyceryl transferase